jgi:hypothetical protein
MSISPFSARPASPDNERQRARMVVLLVVLGIAASLLAYAASPSVRHAVGHAAHSVKGAVGHVLDRDHAQPKAKVAPTGRPPAGAPAPAGSGATPGRGRATTAPASTAPS